MPTWTPCPHTGVYRYTGATLAPLWSRLHARDAEPLPSDPALLDAWALFHNGEFQRAAAAGMSLGAAGLNLANKASCIYATYVEPSEAARLDLLLAAAERAQAQQVLYPQDPNAWYWQAYALGRYSQGISVAKALARGLGTKVRQAFQTAIELAPGHVDAQLGLAHFHAEVIDKVGELIGGMLHGARKDQGLALYASALALNPDSAITQNEYAQGLLMLEGDPARPRVAALRERVAGFEPLDAMERLYLDGIAATA
jgi:tetratricopeptide (TPR) repeat protein